MNKSMKYLQSLSVVNDAMWFLEDESIIFASCFRSVGEYGGTDSFSRNRGDEVIYPL